MDTYKVDIAIKFAKRGACQELLRDFLGFKYSKAKQIVSEFGDPVNSKDRVILGARFLTIDTQLKESEVWYSIYNNVYHKCSFTKFIVAYDIYKDLRKSPLSINKCYGVIKSVFENQITIHSYPDGSFSLLSKKPTSSVRKTQQIQDSVIAVNEKFDTQALLS